MDGEKITDHQEILNIFDKYFANIGTKLASSINVATKLKHSNRTSSPQQKRLYSFSKVCEPEVQQIINQPKNKQSRGVNKTSSQLLKVLGKEICKSLTLIINQMIETGMHPENFKSQK